MSPACLPKLWQLRIPIQVSFRTWCLLAFAIVPLALRAEAPYGLDSRSLIGPYLNNIMPPRAGALGFPFPPVLSATGAFRDLRTLTPAEGLISFSVNSPFWSDGAIKTRWMAVPNDGPPYGPTEQIGFTPVGEWTFPEGTVFIKHFEMVVNEETGERRRMETRFLVRSSDGRYGITYKWRADQTDADLLDAGLDEDIAITTSTGATRIQRYTYPSRSDCLFCHNRQAGSVLGPKTHQLNGEFTYPATGRTDNQLRTLNHLGLFNPPPSDLTFSSYLKSVAVTHPTAPVQVRMRSWIDANCSHCHRPDGPGPGYDGRFYTPLESQNLINTYVKFRDPTGSQLYQRDNALDATKMPPLAKNLVHEAATTVLRQWIASPLEVLSVYFYRDTNHLSVRFNSQVDPVTAVIPSNYVLDQGATISEVVIGSQPDTVILTVSSLTPNQVCLLTITGVQDTAPSANTIWPGTATSFTALFPAAATSTRLANISARLTVGPDDNAAISGFILRGASPKRAMVRAMGPTLKLAGIAHGVADPTLEIVDHTGVVMAANDNWADNANQQEIIDTGLAPASSQEAAVLTKFPSNEGGLSYTAILRGTEKNDAIGLLEFYDLEGGLGSELLNVSVRGHVGSADNALIGGFIIVGPGSKRVIVRAIGPSLSVSGKIADPTLELHDGNGTILEWNNNWVESVNKQAIIDSTIPPSNSLESAMVRTLTAGNYTAVVRGVNDSTGIAVVEVYALN